MEKKYHSTKTSTVLEYIQDNPSKIPAINSAVPQYTPSERLSVYYGFRGMLGLKINFEKAKNNNFEACQADIYITGNSQEISTLPKYGLAHVQHIRILDLTKLLSDLAIKVKDLIQCPKHTGIHINNFVLKNPNCINTIFESDLFPNLTAIVLTAIVKSTGPKIRNIPRLRFAVIKDIRAIESIKIHGYPIQISQCKIEPFAATVPL